MSYTNESTTHTFPKSQALYRKNNIRNYVIMSYQLSDKKRGGREKINLSRSQVEHSISITRSMRQAAMYLNISYNIFKREAKKHNLFQAASGKGIKRVYQASFSNEMLRRILNGEQLMNYRETMLLRKAFHEGYLEKACSNCEASYIHNTDKQPPPLVLDFLDCDNTNGKQANLRVLCLNCVYDLQSVKRGWYRHRDVPLYQVVDDELPPKIKVLDDSLEFIPFENFQKTLNN